MNALTIILDIVLILISIVLIIAVLMQQGQRQGWGASSGGAETCFGKNKAKGYEAKMAKITKIGAAVFIVAAIAATIVASHQTEDSSVSTGDTTYTEEELAHDHDGDGIPDHTADEHTDADSTEAPMTDATEEPAADATEAPATEATEAPVTDATEEPAAAATDEPAAASDSAAEETQTPAEDSAAQ